MAAPVKFFNNIFNKSTAPLVCDEGNVNIKQEPMDYQEVKPVDFWAKLRKELVNEEDRKPDVQVKDEPIDEEEVNPNVDLLVEIKKEPVDEEDRKPDVQVKDEPIDEEEVNPNVDLLVEIKKEPVDEEDVKPDVDPLVQIKEEPIGDIKPRAPRRANRAPNRRQMMMELENADQEFVIIGPNRTSVPKAAFCSIDFKSSYTLATRRLLMALFTRETLATHSLSGKLSNAFLDKIKTPRPQLDARIIQDIIHTVVDKSNKSESDVRRVITKKCCDEHKMMKRQLQKKIKLKNQL